MIVVIAIVVFVGVVLVGVLLARQLKRRHQLLLENEKQPPQPYFNSSFHRDLYYESNNNTQAQSIASYSNMPQNMTGLQLYEPIGSGSFGNVYRGKWKGFLVAVKVQRHVSDVSTQKIRREAELSLKMKHPNVV